MEINFHFLEDEDLSQLILDDCLQLLNSTVDNIDEEKQQLWFKRLWNLLVFGSNKRRIDQVKTHEECIGLFVEILESYISFFPKKCSLLVKLLQKLPRDQSPFHYIVDLLKSHQFEVNLQQDPISIQNQQLIYQWDEAKKTILVNMMTTSAYADEFISYEEEELIHWTIDVLLDSPESKRSCGIYLNHPQHLEQLLEATKSHSDENFKNTVFDSCLKVMVVDKHLHINELDLIHKLELILGIADSNRLSKDFLRTHFLEPDFSLDTLRYWRNPTSREESTMFISHLKQFVSLFCWKYLHPLLIKLEQYYQCEDSATAQSFMTLFSAESLHRKILSNIDRLVKHQVSYLDEMFPEVHGKLESFAPQLKNQLLRESAALDKGLLEMAYSAERLEERILGHESEFSSLTKQSCVEVLIYELPSLLATPNDLLKQWEIQRMGLLKSASLFHSNITGFILDSIAEWIPSVNSEKLYT